MNNPFINYLLVTENDGRNPTVWAFEQSEKGLYAAGRDFDNYYRSTPTQVRPITVARAKKAELWDTPEFKLWQEKGFGDRYSFNLGKPKN